MDHQLAACRGVLPWPRLGDVSGHHLSARVTDQVTPAHLVTLGGVALAERPADEPGCPGGEHAHARRIYPVGGIVAIAPKTSRPTPSQCAAGSLPR